MQVSQFLSLIVGGTKLTRSKIKEILLADYKDEMIVISFPGLANILIFKRKANEMLRIQKKDNQDEIHLGCVAKSIVKNIKDISCDKNVYQAKIDLIICG